MNFRQFKLLNWQLKYSSQAKYNLSASGITEPDLKKMGIDTSFENFAKEPDNHEALLAETIARLYGRKANNVVITNGASEAIFLVYTSIAKNRVIVPLPEYEPMFTIPRTLGLSTGREVSENHFLNGVMIGFSNPNNPTGLFTNDEKVIDLAKLLRKYNGILFSNETYRGFNFGKQFCKEYSEVDNLIICGSLTKFYGLGRLRIGWIVSESRMRDRLVKAKRLVSGHSSEYCMWIARQVLDKSGKFAERARRILLRNTRLLKKFIHEADGVETYIPNAAPFCLIKYRLKVDSVTFARDLLRKNGVLVSPGDYFGSPHSFRLCITAEEDVLKVGLEKLSRYVQGMKEQGS